MPPARESHPARFLARLDFLHHRRSHSPGHYFDKYRRQFDDGAATITYTPYAIREGIYQRGWDGYLRLLTQFWQPYLDGKSTFDDAIARMVSAL